MSYEPYSKPKTGDFDWGNEMVGDVPVIGETQSLYVTEVKKTETGDRYYGFLKSKLINWKD